MISVDNQSKRCFGPPRLDEPGPEGAPLGVFVSRVRIGCCVFRVLERDDVSIVSSISSKVGSPVRKKVKGKGVGGAPRQGSRLVNTFPPPPAEIIVRQENPAGCASSLERKELPHPHSPALVPRHLGRWLSASDWSRESGERRCAERSSRLERGRVPKVASTTAASLSCACMHACMQSSRNRHRL